MESGTKGSKTKAQSSKIKQTKPPNGDLLLMGCSDFLIAKERAGESSNVTFKLLGVNDRIQAIDKITKLLKDRQ